MGLELRATRFFLVALLARCRLHQVGRSGRTPAEPYLPPGRSDVSRGGDSCQGKSAVFHCDPSKLWKLPPRKPVLAF